MFWIGVVVGVFAGWILFERPKVVTDLFYWVRYRLRDMTGLDL